MPADQLAHQIGVAAERNVVELDLGGIGEGGRGKMGDGADRGRGKGQRSLARAASTMSRAVLKGESGRTISAIWFSKVWQIGTNDLSV